MAATIGMLQFANAGGGDTDFSGIITFLRDKIRAA